MKLPHGELEPEFSLTKDRVSRKLYYGWVIAVLGAVLLFVNGQFVYSFGIFVRPLIDSFGWSRTAISSIASIRCILTSVLSPVSGTLSDRYGSKRLILIGIILCGLGYVASWRPAGLCHLYLSFSVLIGIGNGILITPVIATVNKWFPGKSSLANGITMSGTGLAQTIVPLVATFIIMNWGWEISLLSIGVAVWVVGTPIWIFFRAPPSDVLHKPGATITEASGPESSSNDSFTLSEALHTTGFWIIFLGFIFASICFQMVTVHIVVAAIDMGATPGVAASVLVVIGATNTVGRLVVGGLGDRIGKKKLLTIALGMQCAALFALTRANTISAFFIIAAVYGLFYGGEIPNIMSLAGTFFGTRYIGAIIGALTLGYLGAGAIGPVLGGYIFDTTGSYYAAFLVTAIALGVAFLVCFLLKTPRKKTLVA